MIMYYMLRKSIDLIKFLVIHPENMLKNLNLTNGLIYSQAILLALTKKGVSREEAYRLVQRNAMRVWDEKNDFKKVLMEDEQILQFLSNEEIKDICNLENRLKNTKYIFERLGI